MHGIILKWKESKEESIEETTLASKDILKKTAALTNKVNSYQSGKENGNDETDMEGLKLIPVLPSHFCLHKVDVSGDSHTC